MRQTSLLIALIFSICVLHGQKSTFNIGFLLDNRNSEIDSLLNVLEDEIIAVVGEDAMVSFSKTNRLVNNFDKAIATKNYEQYLEGDIDIIIAFGIVNNATLYKRQNYPKPTIVFGFLSTELLQEIELKEDIENYISIVTTQSYREDLEYLVELAKPKRIGVVLEAGYLTSSPVESIFDKIGTDLQFEPKFISFEKFEDITANLDDIDALYLAGGYYLESDEIRELAELLIEKKIPSFTANPINDVENGILATNHDKASLEQFFRRLALAVETIVNGNTMEGLGVRLETNKALTINYNTADRIGLPLKYSLIATTDFIGDPKKQVADKTYNLVAVMQEAIIENLQLETFRQDIELTNKDVQLSKSEYLPDVSANAAGNYTDPAIAELGFGQTPEVQAIGNVGLNQLVFSNSANANITIQRALRDAQQENYNSEELNTVFSAAQAYFTALILKANLSIQNQNLGLTKYNLKIAEENYEAGQAGKSDVLRFRSEMAQNTQQMVEAVNQLEQAFYNLNFILNNPIESKIDVEEAELLEGVFENYNYKQLGTFLDDPTLRLPFVKFLVQEAMDNAPELKVLDYNLEATKRSERLFGAGRFLPTVALQGQYNYEFSRSGVGSTFLGGRTRPKDFYTFGLNVTLPIFNQNKQNINQQIAEIQTKQLNVSKDNLKLNIEKNINDAVLNIINQISNIQLSKVFEETAKEALELTQTSYASGAVNIVQLLDAQNNYLQAQLASANATYNYLLTSLQLERFLGTFFLLQTERERDDFRKRFLEFTQSNND
jgi:outer membrane protein